MPHVPDHNQVVREEFTRQAAAYAANPAIADPERIARLVRSEFDRLRLSRYEAFDLRSVLAANTVDFGLGSVTNHWFGERHMSSLRQEIPAFARSLSRIVRS